MKKKLFSLLLMFCVCAGAWADQYPDVLYAVGNSTSSGWLGNTDNQLFKISGNDTDGYIYQGFVNFTAAGELKFLCQTSWSDMWGAKSAGYEITATGEYDMEFHENGTDDYKFDISFASGLYFITINTGTNKVKFELGTTEINIGNAAGLNMFAYAANTFGQTSELNAKLTTDIDMSSYTSFGIGNNDKQYKGTFDGNYYTVKLNINSTNDYVGFIGRGSTGTTVKNLIVTGSVTGASFVGGIMGGTYGTGDIKFENCGNEAKITANTKNAGGILGCNLNSSNHIDLTNCYNTGEIRGTSENGALCGWIGGSNSSVSNVYNTGKVYNNDVQSTSYIRWENGCSFSNIYVLDDSGTNGENRILPVTFTESQMESGELCCKLGNSSWFQNLTGDKKDTHPVPFKNHSTVYANITYKCDGITIKSTKYSNTSEEAVTDNTHEYGDNGFCSVCNTAQEPNLSEGDYQIANFGNLVWFAATVNNGTTSAKAVLKADISQGSAIYTPIGNSDHNYIGTFDGQNHNVTLNTESSNYEQYDHQGLFGILNGATIKNIIVKGNVGGKAFVGGIAGASYGTTTIECCGNEAYIHASAQNAGGVVGCVFDGQITLKNCYNTGNIVGDKESAGISGWLGSNAVVTNCYNAGKVESGVDGTKTFARWNSGTYTNCYNTLSANTFAGRIDSYATDKVTSGELCVALGSAFTQENLGEDGSHPTFGKNVVGSVTLKAQDENDVYYATFSNSNAVKFNTATTVSTVKVSDSKMTVSAVDSRQVPAENGVLINSTANNVYYEIIASAGALSDNMLYPASKDKSELSGCKFFMLAYSDSNKTPSTLGFYYGATDGATFTSRTGSAYLAVPTDQCAKTGFAFGDADADGIEAVETTIENAPAYNIAGQRVNANTKGIVIVNGKKYLNK